MPTLNYYIINTEKQSLANEDNKHIRIIPLKRILDKKSTRPSKISQKAIYKYG